MTTVRERHDRAMRLADEMLAARREHDRDAARQLATAAFLEELAAAELAFARGVSGVTRITLLRSAANLARDAQQWEAGLDLTLRALATADLRDHRPELLQILDTLRTYEHLQLTGVRLADGDVQLTVAGPEAAPGFARAEEVTRRVEYVRALMLRSALRRRGIPFGDSPPRTAKFREAFTPYLSTARAASYAVTVRFGVHEQTELDLADSPQDHAISVEQALDDVMLVARAYAEGGPAEIQRLIPEEQYARNAASLLRQLSPDEERIATVGLTVRRNGSADAVALPSRRVVPPVPTWMPNTMRRQALPSPVFSVVGRLLEGSARTPEKAWATIVTDEGESLRIRYDETTHGDIIKEYWKRRVSAHLIRHKALGALLKDIDDA
jgi:hypothetical protein